MQNPLLCLATMLKRDSHLNVSLSQSLYGYKARLLLRSVFASGIRHGSVPRVAASSPFQALYVPGQQTRKENGTLHVEVSGSCSSVSRFGRQTPTQA